MRFTVVFDGPESRDVSYGLVFVPCPVWVAGDRQILNLHPEDPRFRSGDVTRLVKAEKLESLLTHGYRRCTVVIHSDGNGSLQDLAALLHDLRAEQFRVTLAGSV